ncbi:hypothetical protein Tco_1401523 [Tanacetum coccineum]
MADSSSHKPSSPEITPKEEPVTLDKPEILNPFLPDVPQGKKPKAKSGLRRKQISKHTSESKTKASKSKSGQSKKETQSSSAMDKSPSHPSPPTLVVGEMHKEAQQAAGGPTYLGAASEDGAHPQLSSGHDASADSIAEVDPGLSAPNDSIPSQQDQTKSPEDGLKTTQTDSGTYKEFRADEISKKIKLEDLSDLLKDTRFAFFTLDSPQDEPIIKDELKQQKAKAEAEVASLKARPSYRDVNQLTTLLVAELKNIQWELPAELQALPVVSLVQKHLKTLDSLPSQLNKVIEILNRFATVVENASEATTKDVPSTGQATASPAEGKKNTTKDAKINLQNDLVDLLGIDVVERYHKKKKDGIIEVIANFKISDLHLAEWREVVQACPARKEKGWKTIYGLIKTRMEYLDQTKRELKIDFNKLLKEQDPLNEQNELANKKRKRTSDLKDHSRSTKKHKSSSSA